MHAPAHPIRVFADQLGVRFLERGADGTAVERLDVAPVLAGLPEFRRAVVARSKSLSFSPAVTIARVFGADGSGHGAGELTVRSEPTEGERLAALIARRREEERPFTLDELLYVLRGAVSAVRELHSSGNGICHGAVSAGRFVLATDGRMVLHDCMFGGALASLSWAPTRLREALGIRVPDLPDIPAFTPLTDQFQLGLLAFHLVTGDPSLPAEPTAAVAALADARVLAADANRVSLPAGLQKLIARTLLLSADGPFRSFLALERALDGVVSASGASPEPPEIAVEQFDAANPEATAAVPAAVPAEPDTPAVDVAAAQRAAIAVTEGTLTTMPQIRPWWDQRSQGSDLRPGLSNPVGLRPGVREGPGDPVSAEAATAGGAPVPSGPTSGELLHAEADRLAPPAAHTPLWSSAQEALPFRPAEPVAAGRPVTGLTHAAASDPPFAPPATLSVRPADTGAAARRLTTGTSVPASALQAGPAGAYSEPADVENRASIRLQARHEPEEATFDAGNIEELLAQRRATLQDAEIEPSPRSWLRPVVIVSAAVGIVGLLGYYLSAGATQAFETWRKPPQGTLRLESKPAGATVFVEGTERGRTPLTLSVAPGDYRVEMLLGDEAKAMTVPVENGGDAYQIVSLYPTGPPGTLEIRSAPTGVAVSIDGEPRGTTPLSLSDIAPGEHVISAATQVARVEKTVEVMAGASVPVILPISGSIELHAPFEVSVYDRSKSIGTGRSGRFEVPAGKRLLSFVNDELLFEEVRAVDVPAGQVVRVDIAPPTGVLNFTSDVDSEVFLDGRPLGITPLSNVQVSLGSHLVLYRQPEWGEQQYTILVSMGSPARLHAQMKYKKIEYTPPRNANPPKPRPRR